MSSQRLIYIGNLPFQVQPEILVDTLTKLFQPHTVQVTITPFSHKHRKKRGCEHKLHPGFGYVEVDVNEGLELLMQNVREVDNLAGHPVSLKVDLSNQTGVSVTKKLSKVTNVRDCGESSECLEKRLAHRQHKKRQRQRSHNRRNDMLMSIIEHIPAPGGQYNH